MNVTERDTRQHIRDVAMQLVQSRGYHAFSYADVSAQVGVRKASIHYHFPNKHDLVRDVVAYYRAGSRAMIAQAAALNLSAREQLAGAVEMLAQEVNGQPRMCLCALLAAEMPTLPDVVRTEVQGFYNDQYEWFTAVLESGRVDGTLQVNGSSEVAAQVILAGLEGAMLAARAFNDSQRFLAIGQQLIRAYFVAP